MKYLTENCDLSSKKSVITRCAEMGLSDDDTAAICRLHDSVSCVADFITALNEWGYRRILSPDERHQ